MKESDFLKEVLLGDEEAVSLCQMLGRLSQIWDDVVDGAFVPHKDINYAFRIALFDIHENAFFIQHRAELVPVMKMAMHDWFDSIALERTTQPNDKVLAYVLRDSLVGVVVQIVRLIGGAEYAVEVGPTIRQYFHDESLGDYLKGIA